MALLDSSGNAVKSAAGSIFNAFSPSASPISKPSAYSYGTNQGSGVVNSLKEGSKTQYPVGFNKNSVNQAPSSALGMLGAFLSPAATAAQSVGKTFLNQVNYGMNDEAAANYTNLVNAPANAGMSAAQLVQMARAPYMAANNLNANPAAQPSNMSDEIWSGLSEGQRNFFGRGATGSGATGSGSTGSGGNGGGGNGGGGAVVPLGGGAPGTFKPITFRQGAADLTVPEATEFNYDFDPTEAANSLFSERSALLDPAFAQQRTKNKESMQGMGRLGLMLSGEALGAGEGTGMMNPDMYGMNAAQSNALAQLSAQSTLDSFGQEVQRAGLDLSEYMTNQDAQQNMFGNNMSLEALRQNYELAQQGYQLQRDQFDYNSSKSDNGWLTGLTSLGSSFLGTKAGGNWLSNGFSKGGWFS